MSRAMSGNGEKVGRFRKIACWFGWCGLEPKSDDIAVWGECARCGKIEGMISRQSIRNYLDNEARFNEMNQIKEEHFADIKGRDTILLVKSDYGWRVEQWFKDGVAPSSDYDIPAEAAARVLQLLGLSTPVTPQNWPETAQMGGGKSPPPRHPYPGDQS